MTRLTHALMRAYHDTTYRVGDGILRIGGRSAAADAALRRLGARQGGLVSAHNPFSRRTAPGRNARHHRRLVEAARRFRSVDALGGPGTDWEEPMLLVAADPRVIARLGRRFRQHAVVALRRDGPARLLRLSPGPMIRDTDRA
ncbi:DUF3293 domain-containing protein [Roseomonas sp. CCTCC AB2023176]|uniref:DUF3293 domain-containing protein n=1 Tax=Roseomonas sp. CCTCC AB2023176 TaxID=3342640 RepID=UPI0035DAD8EA